MEGSAIRKILVTGAASGIGLATLRLAQARGIEVIGLDLAGADIVGDLSNQAGRDAAVAAIRARLDGAPLDAIIACAGLAGGDARRIMAVNLFGATRLLTSLHDLLAEGTAPRVVVMSSTALLHLPLLGRNVVDAALADDEAEATALVDGQPDLAYFASKAALSLWVKREAVKPEWAGQGILLNAVAPGATGTPMIQDVLADEAGRNFLMRMTPVRLATGPARPEDLAELVLFLASPDNRYMVGQTLFCDGGAEAVLRPTLI